MGARCAEKFKRHNVTDGGCAGTHIDSSPTTIHTRTSTPHSPPPRQMLGSRRTAAAGHSQRRHSQQQSNHAVTSRCCCILNTTTTTSSSSSSPRGAICSTSSPRGAICSTSSSRHHQCSTQRAMAAGALAQRQGHCTASTSSPVAARAFVGTASPLAGEYHSSDFDWQQHASEVAPLLEAQWNAAPAAVRDAAQLDGNGNPLSAVTVLLASLKTAGGISRSDVSSSSSSVVTPQAACEQHHHHHQPAAASSGIQGREQQHQQPRQNEWEEFYRAHPAAKFFKERRYLLLEFPCLAPPAQLGHVVEIGAGCGSSILPVLRAQPGARATLCDVSATCLSQLGAAAAHAGLDVGRIKSFVADGTSPELGQRLSCAAADAALIMFTLSAVPPDGMLVMMANAAAALRPGGLLCIRDHALGDMVQLRIAPEQCIGRHLYRRGEGTLAYFYTTQELVGLAQAVGLEVVESEYVCVVNHNRKTGQQLRRAFVHGLFRKKERGLVTH